MISANIEIFKHLKEFLTIVYTNQENRELFISKSTDFSRLSKLSFYNTIYLILNMLKRSLSIEINDFFELIDSESTCTKSAFSQQRKKLSPVFFECWNNFLVNLFYIYYGYKLKKWKDFLIIAVDGSTTNLINKEEIIKHYGYQENQFGKVPLARIMKFYDVLNDINIFAKIYPISIGEQSIVTQKIEELPENSLSIYDRGFPSYTLMYLLINQERTRHFLIRCKNDFNNIVKEFVNSTETDKIVNFFPNDNSINDLSKFCFTIFKHTPIKIRMVKVLLDTGEIEILLTNLYENSLYPTDCFKELYHMRWGIETSYDKEKNSLQLEQFSGQSVVSIEQDFYALIFVSNIQNLIEKQCENHIIKINKRRKLDYKVNKNVSIGNLKNKIVQLFLTKTPEKILSHLQKLFEKDLIPIRPNRKPNRDKTKRNKGKFRTLTNYKRAI